MAFNLIYRPLQYPWNNTYFHRALKDPDLFAPEKGGDCFLVVQSVCGLHESVNLAAQSLDESWRENDEYIKSGCVGTPPLACHPIYLISIGDGEEEKIVYVGKTSSNSSRFSSGHAAISKLHAPEYDGLSKRLYLCGVVFLKSGKEIPVEWVNPFCHAESLLKSFEANLIYWTQPELNTQHKSSEPIFEYGQVHVQNVTGSTSFWHDKFI